MLEEDIKQIYREYLRFPKDMKYTKSDEVCFQAAEKCHICGGEPPLSCPYLAPFLICSEIMVKNRQR